MRRSFQRKQKPSADSPGSPPDPNAPPARPADLVKAQGILQESLLGKEAHVATGYGFGDDPKVRTSEWRLYVFTDLTREQLPLPGHVLDFPVARRSVPRASKPNTYRR